jgi:hypothetical protein
MLYPLAAAVLLAAPSLGELPPLTAELPSLKDLPKPAGQGGQNAGEHLVTMKTTACAEGAQLDVTRVVQVALRTVERLQGWLDANPGLEEKLFATRGQLGEVAKLAAGSRVEPGGFCTLPVDEKWKLSPPAVLPATCKGGKGGAAGLSTWWSHGGKPAIASKVSSHTGCKPRVSMVLFDQAGKARLKFHSDLENPPSFTLLGDQCRNVDFAFDEKANGFTARASSCKP